ncbi:MFS transporter [Terriglobus roseus]|uniref:MFS transporter, PAT family, beta-lactamase induction signal transducer AmpG n=1 Tax=Terriglobus roseus TaxID=392734 RepID=A0A1H4MH32_9BACT|nr:MFS transporter [Terriglobus roseus]SEB82167.1 MFS transporter, PAT family, beta-lactamase induction signal transducer AmpG [Terriglobus roseus]
MDRRAKLPPIFLLGLTNSTYGMAGGFACVVLPEMLAAQGVSGGRIGAIVAWILLALVWSFFLSPMLDVRFSRRRYALVFAALASSGVAVTVMHHGNSFLVEMVMVATYAAASLLQAAVGGWMGSLISRQDDAKLGAWFAIGNTGAGGLMILVGGDLVFRLRPAAAAAALAAMMMLPTLIYLVVPAPGPDRRLASESFRQFFGEIVALLRRRTVLIVLVLFLMPAASFALCNILAGVGADFHASASVINFSGGIGVLLAGLAGSLAVPILARRIPLKGLYLAIGVVGALFTFGVWAMPRMPWVFALALIGENIFQASAFSVEAGIAFESIGSDNPLASTQFSLLMAASGVPITYMGLIDSHIYDLHGLTGGMLADAGISVAVCMVLGAWLIWLRGRAKQAA